MKPEPVTVTVPLADRSYPIVIGAGVLDRAGELIAPVLRQPRVHIVADAAVAAIHLPRLEAALDRADIAHAVTLVPPGEASKSFSQFERLLDALLDARVERKTALIALGGGVTGDLAGFAAAVALRGIDFVQVPTTLLAQVDSAVGGKTGIDTRHGKNLVGAFHQPRLVIADTAVLDTLPPREVRAGYAEVAKYGLIDRPAFWQWLEENGRAVIGDGVDLAARDAARAHAIAESCRAKAEIVGADERESGARALLNLGHTFAHALESLAGFGDAVRHGEAVGIGMVLAFALSERLGLCPAGRAERVRAHLAAVGLPTSPADIPVAYAPDALYAAMLGDKKVEGGRIGFVLARDIGRAFAAADAPAEIVRAVLAEALEARR
ncbi:3-dehydroquinate synthase [uncultured Alphaproteobacteria bacterium]|uniref:3-dehydroquinate synthase n=1 Tax=uncultured Alphaproteobacteria bacterium TaxID=91750 RepID=A0A212KIJ3_9PROT|nr:3-dehydroquinate synthase [uncultured Alphaproteobacteria bacterium]